MDNQIYRIQQLDASSWLITEKGKRLDMHCYLAAGKDKALLVDTGFGRGDLREAVAELTKLPVTLVNSHADWDHVGGNGQFGLAHMHPADYARYQDIAPEAAPPAPLWDGDVIDLGGRRFEVILIPGHTPGSIALLDAENRTLVAGDSIQAGMIFMFEPGRSLAAYVESMKKLDAAQGRFDKVVAAHGQAVLDSGMIGELAALGEKTLGGQIKGIPVPAPFDELQAKLYALGRAGLLYQ